MKTYLITIEYAEDVHERFSVTTSIETGQMVRAQLRRELGDKLCGDVEVHVCALEQTTINDIAAHVRETLEDG